MSTNVYTLASPSPTLYAFPSQLHPAPPHIGAGGNFQRRQPAPRPHRDDDETALAVLGAL